MKQKDDPQAPINLKGWATKLLNRQQVYKREEKKKVNGPDKAVWKKQVLAAETT